MRAFFHPPLLLRVPARAMALALSLALSLALPLGMPWAQAQTPKPAKATRSLAPAAAPFATTNGLSSQQIDERLLGIYHAIAEAKNREALALAEKLTQIQPNFQLGQMLYADLLLAQTRPVAMPGSAPEALTRDAPGAITDLRDEARQRIKALQERPPAGAIPENFTAINSWSPHAIAVDISKSRLYLFARNAAGQLQLQHDYYISIARLGAVKTNEGDLRTPLGIYFITSHLQPEQVGSFYGAGALPLNYPNPYDVRRGKSGSGIWLHGTPATQYSRAPQASEGCVVMTNPDFRVLSSAVELRTTPVVIAPQLRWVPENAAQNTAQNATQSAWLNSFDAAWLAWRQTKLAGDLPQLAPFYYANFAGQNKLSWPQFYNTLLQEKRAGGLRLPEHLSAVSRLYWRESADEEIVITTFAQTVAGKSKNRRQYWRRKGGEPWRIFYESDV